MCIVEGESVDGHVGDESSPKRNACVNVFEYLSLFSLLLFCRVLSCLVLWCGVVWCVCVGGRVGVQHTLRSFPQESCS